MDMGESLHVGTVPNCVGMRGGEGVGGQVLTIVFQAGL